MMIRHYADIDFLPNIDKLIGGLNTRFVEQTCID